MDRTSYVISLNDMIGNFFPALESEQSASAAIPNVFIEVPAFHCEQDMYGYIVSFIIRFLP